MQLHIGRLQGSAGPTVHFARQLGFSPCVCTKRSALPAQRRRPTVHNVQAVDAESTQVKIEQAELRKLQDIQSMYSQLAQQTQTIYRSEQEKARQVATLREEVAQKDNLLGRAKGLCGKLLSFRRKSRLDTAAQQETAASIQLAREEAKAEAKAELQQVKEAADYYRTKWYESLDETEEQGLRSRKAKAAQRRLARELDSTKLKLRRLQRVL